MLLAALRAGNYMCYLLCSHAGNYECYLCSHAGNYECYLCSHAGNYKCYLCSHAGNYKCYLCSHAGNYECYLCSHAGNYKCYLCSHAGNYKCYLCSHAGNYKCYLLCSHAIVTSLTFQYAWQLIRCDTNISKLLNFKFHENAFSGSRFVLSVPADEHNQNNQNNQYFVSRDWKTAEAITAAGRTFTVSRYKKRAWIVCLSVSFWLIKDSFVVPFLCGWRNWVSCFITSSSLGLSQDSPRAAVTRLLDSYLWRGSVLKWEALSTNRTPFPIHFKNIHSYWSYKRTANTVNDFEIGITPPGRSDMSLAATTPSRLQRRTLLGSSASRQCGHYCSCGLLAKRPMVWIDKRWLLLGWFNTHARVPSIASSLLDCFVSD